MYRITRACFRRAALFNAGCVMRDAVVDVVLFVFVLTLTVKIKKR